MTQIERPCQIRITLAELWNAYGRGRSGRYPCPITVLHVGEATHIYQGYGAIRLERIAGQPSRGKGFQGQTIAQGHPETPITILD